MNETTDYKKLYEDEKRKSDKLAQIIDYYETAGAAKLFYGINRKMHEMADMLNKCSMGDINLDDAKDKSFERIFRLLEKSETISNAAKALGELAGVTGDEEKDTAKRLFTTRLATKRTE